MDVASKGGNYLLNIGPMSDGEFPPQAVERLKAIGDYMKVSGDAIYDTKASLFENPPWAVRRPDTTAIRPPSTFMFLIGPRTASFACPDLETIPRKQFCWGAMN